MADRRPLVVNIGEVQELPVGDTLGAHVDHTGMSADDHAQYLLLAGRAGGQTAIGGTLTTQGLTLQDNVVDANQITWDNGLFDMGATSPNKARFGHIAIMRAAGPTNTHNIIIEEDYTVATLGYGGTPAIPGTSVISIGSFNNYAPEFYGANSVAAIQGNTWFDTPNYSPGSQIRCLDFYPAPEVVATAWGSYEAVISGINTAGLLNVAQRVVKADTITAINAPPLAAIFGGDFTSANVVRGVNILSAYATSGTWGRLCGLQIGAQISGEENQGIWIDGDGIGADLALGEGFTDVRGRGDAFTKVATTMTLTDSAGLFTSAMVGRKLIIRGATSAANDGVFSISLYVSATQIEYVNIPGVVEPFPKLDVFGTGDSFSKTGSVITFTKAAVNGTGDRLIFASPTITINDAAGDFTPGMVGRTVTIAGSVNPANDGTFIVTAYVKATQIQYENASGVGEFIWPGTWVVDPFLSSMVGRKIHIESADTVGNDGDFTITAYLGPTQITWTNGAGATDASFTGGWTILGGAWFIPGEPDASIYYDGNDLIIDPDKLTAGDRVLIGTTGDDDVKLNDLELTTAYFGDAATNGSWRIVKSGNDLAFERRESGSWVEKGAFTAV